MTIQEMRSGQFVAARPATTDYAPGEPWCSNGHPGEDADLYDGRYGRGYCTGCHSTRNGYSPRTRRRASWRQS